jgi:hypothetical protein
MPSAFDPTAASPLVATPAAAVPCLVAVSLGSVSRPLAVALASVVAFVGALAAFEALVAAGLPDAHALVCGFALVQPAFGAAVTLGGDVDTAAHWSRRRLGALALDAALTVAAGAVAGAAVVAALVRTGRLPGDRAAAALPAVSAVALAAVYARTRAYRTGGD